jgi:hypothetical protein
MFPRYWIWLSIFLLFINVALTIGAMLSPRWVMDSDLQSEHYGSLFVWDLVEGYTNYGHICLAGPSCASSDNSVICSTFRDLHDAGVLYVASQVLLMLTFIMWLENCLY